MRRLKLLLQYTFGISKVEANGLIILLPLIFILILLPGIIGKLTFSEITFEKEVQQLNEMLAALEIDSVGSTPPVYHYEVFDPNQVSSEALKLMGLRQTVVNNWRKYLEHGGKFYSPDDVKKVYTLSDSMFNIIKPYIKIRKQPSVRHAQTAKRTSFDRSDKKRNTPRKKRLSIQPFDLNTADTLQLRQVRGIGSVLSKRIIKYREILGGFVRKSQLGEVYGLKDSVLQHLDTLVFITSTSPLRYLKINVASDHELERHPYISRKAASAIVAYRYQHGAFEVPDDLHNIHLLDSLTIAKIAPYLKF